MRWLALILAAGLFLVHDGTRFLAAHSRFTTGDTHYMLQGLGGLMLAGCLMVFIASAKKDFWVWMAIAALVFWMLEQAMIVGCRLMVGEITQEVANVGMCTYATGIPFGNALTWIEALFFSSAFGYRIGSYLFGRRDED